MSSKTSLESDCRFKSIPKQIEWQEPRVMWVGRSAIAHRRHPRFLNSIEYGELMAREDIVNAGRSPVRQTGSSFTNSHGAREPSHRPQWAAPGYSRQSVNGNAQLPPSRSGFSAQTATPPGNPNPPFQYGHIPEAIPNFLSRPGGNSNESNHVQAGVYSFAENQRNTHHAVAQIPQANNSIGAAGYPAGYHENAGPDVHGLMRMFEQRGGNANPPAPNVFAYPAAETPRMLNNVKERAAELARQNFNLVPSQANTVQPGIRNPFAGAPAPIVPNNFASTPSSHVLQGRNPMDFVRQMPATNSIHGASQGQAELHPFSNVHPFSNAQGTTHSAADYQNAVNRLLAGRVHQVITLPFGTPLGVRVNETGATVVTGHPMSGATDIHQFPVGVSVFGPVPYRPQNVPGANAPQAPTNRGNPIVTVRL